MSKSTSTRSEIRGAKTSPYLRPGRNKVLKRSRRRRFVRRGTALAVIAAVGLGLAAWGGSIGWRWLSSTPPSHQIRRLSLSATLITPLAVS